MTKFWAKFSHILAIIGQLASINHVLIPAVAGPYVTVGLAIGQLLIGLKQHNSNPDGSPASLPYNP
jgi:hypothetical protein